MLATILLSPGAVRVTVGDIPRLIADAIHPALPDDTPRVVSYIQKQAVSQVLANEWCGMGNNFPVSLSDDDWHTLNRGVWANLPPLLPGPESDDGPRKLARPLPAPQWEPYRIAYEASPPLDWRLYVVWKNTGFEQWLMNYEAQKQWKQLLEQHSMQGRIAPRPPTSCIPTPGVVGRQLQESFLTVEEFTEFAARFSFEVRVLREVTRPVLVAPLLDSLRKEPPGDFARFKECIGGNTCEATRSIGDYVAELDDVARRQVEGYLTVGEAAQLLSDAHGTPLKDLIDRMGNATVGKPERRLIRGADRLPVIESDRTRTIFRLVKVEDVDEWLETSLDAPYRLSPLCAVTTLEPVQLTAGTSPSRETVEQRQDRRLARFEELNGKLKRVPGAWNVDNKNGQRGALAQLVKEEKAARCARSDRKDVTADLGAAADRRHQAPG